MEQSIFVLLDVKKIIIFFIIFYIYLFWNLSFRLPFILSYICIQFSLIDPFAYKHPTKT